ncbi:glycosyltransferase family 2 protein [Psychrobacter sp. H7-1]|uniref:glycosyltransferase family 2 protein n=1 Tax=Psychrobacter sp. H7-1 TaxID=1569265 RepID=UPI001919E855|nr:glycosyltransferase [Psychrobacter sp. H7-1]
MSTIVSLTSTSFRLPVLRHNLESLINQSIKPDKILLNISKDPYLADEGIDKLPLWLDELSKSNKITIQWVENIGSYRKLLPVYSFANDDDLIITCDDDVIYGEYWLESLLNTAKLNPNRIVCGGARKPAKSIGNKYQSYINWPLVNAGSSGHDLIPIGVYGIVYRKKLLDNHIIYSKIFKELAPKQDDLWFKFAHELKGTEVVVCKHAGNEVYPINTPTTLSSTNMSVRLPKWSIKTIMPALAARLALKAKARLGVATCDNDIAFRKIQHYKSEL